MKWEYKTINYSKRSFSGRLDPLDLNRVLDDKGREGWELVNVSVVGSWWILPGVIAVFKRPL